jgi:hypothetical protein
MSAITRSILPYLILPLVASVIAWGIRGALADAEVSRLKAAHATQLAEWAEASTAAANRSIQQGNERIQAQEAIKNDAIKQAAGARADLDRVRADASRLRGQLDTIRRDATRRDPTLTNGSPAGASTAGVLSYMLGRAIDRAEFLAGFADESRIEGLACERAYNSLRAN